MPPAGPSHKLRMSARPCCSRMVVRLVQAVSSAKALSRKTRVLSPTRANACPPVGDAKGWQRDGLPGRSRLFSAVRRYGVSGQEDKAIGEGQSGRHCVLDVKSYVMKRHPKYCARQSGRKGSIGCSGTGSDATCRHQAGPEHGVWISPPPWCKVGNRFAVEGAVRCGP